MSDSAGKYNTTLEDYEAQVFNREGIQIRVYGKKTDKVAENYEKKYKNKLGEKKTVHELKRIRIEATLKPGTEYEILGSDFERVNGKKTLENLRKELAGK